MQCRQYGPAAWLVEGIDDAVGWADGLQAADLPGVIEIVPAESSVLVLCNREEQRSVGSRLSAVKPLERSRPRGTVVIDVRYDGVDLDAIAERVGMSSEAVAERHAAGRYRVEFCGFSPGFAYLSGLDPVLHAPRRDSPRNRVPAGSVAIAAHYSAVYPSASPGGWHILGTSAAEIWNADRSAPALLVPGVDVRFRRIAR